MNYNLAQPFFESARANPSKLAVVADGRTLTYAELLEQVTRIVAWLSSASSPPKRVGILGSRSAEACAGILATAWVGATYFPISLKQPEARIIDLLGRSALDAIIADKTGATMLSSAIVKAAPKPVLALSTTATGVAVARYDDLPPAPHVDAPANSSADHIGYVLYTSGSTGTPKGVMIPNRGVEHLLRVMNAMYPLRPDDRLAETADTSFDISVYNMFAAWKTGASLHVIPATQSMGPAKFIQEHQITTWYSVPSVAAFMNRMHLLKPGCFPSLRLTFFCGEPLLTAVAEAWQQAAPNSQVINFYGPTEATVMCTGEEYGPTATFTRDCVAIGRPFPGMKTAIAGSNSNFAGVGEPGELLLSGPQLAMGYLDDAQKTADRFVTIDAERWYRTGDLASFDERGVFHYLGRVDNQVKVLGYRVELEEIECHLRDATHSDAVAAIAWPPQGATGIIAFVGGYSGSLADVKSALQQKLPTYMVPTRIIALREVPLNNNGKVDRGVLRTQLQEGKFAVAAGDAE